jgi:hypothetical protein
MLANAFDHGVGERHRPTGYVGVVDTVRSESGQGLADQVFANGESRFFLRLSVHVATSRASTIRDYADSEARQTSMYRSGE